ncbi:MAG: DNA polymerase I [Clostridia bacterium]|nr:DNA polymerase I [Clostridia bacterium]
MKKLLIVDGNSILNRAFYGVRNLSTKEGLPTNAIYGMMTMLKKHLDSLKPEYAVVAFDLKAKTFRHLECDFYKANRKPMPEDLAIQLPYAKECVKMLGFNILELEGYEADDIIGTVSRIPNDNDVHSYVLTGDRDSLQLINENTSVILAKNKEDVLYTPEKFTEEYGVTPLQYIDVKAIMGDSSDNIPGVSGIGEKGAFKLISEFGSLDALFDNYKDSSLSQGIKSKLESGKDMAYTSKFLATIVLNVPLKKSLDDFKYKGIDVINLRHSFIKFEFGSLIKKFGLDTNIKNEPVVKEDDKPEKIPSQNDQISLFDNVENAISSVNVPSFSEEIIYSLPEVQNEPCAVYFLGNKVQICTSSGKIYEVDGDKAIEFLKTSPIICHDLKTLLRDYEINCVFDTMLAGYVISPSDTSYDLSSLSLSYLECVFEENHGAQIIYRLYAEMIGLLERDNTLHILKDIEIPLARVLYSMEKEGFMVDVKGLNSYSSYLSELESTYKERIYMLAGEEFNVNSPKQLGQILFEKLGLPHGKKTKTGYSTGIDVLEDLSQDYEIVREVLEYRKVAKLNSTYAIGLSKVADENGRIHSTFNQTVAVTGRLSSTEPNLQNIPIRTDLGRNLRKYFITKGEDYVLIDADYSQIELKVLSHMSKDANMIHAFRTGEDVHTMTASLVFGIEPSEVTPELRKRAKAVNFGIVYGIGDFSLGKDLHIPIKEAKRYIESYFATYPDIHAFIKSLIVEARENGYAKTMFGRIRYIPELANKNKMVQAFGERAAMNSPIQGTAADIIKIAMINVDKALKEAKIDARLILQVHDELIIEAHRDCADLALQILKKEMEGATKLLVPLTADISVGKTWFDAK